MSELTDDDGIDGPWESAMGEAVRDDATRQWKRELHAMVARRDERIAELEDQLVEMTIERAQLESRLLDAEVKLEQVGTPEP